MSRKCPRCGKTKNTRGFKKDSSVCKLCTKQLYDSLPAEDNGVD